MEQNFDLELKEEIEEIKDLDEFERIGDSRYLNHSNENARLLWAFYRPSGSHISQLNDSSIDVAIMAFNHSRLTPFKRFKAVNPKVIESQKYRNRVRNRARMLFRALVDDDLSELIEVLELYPIYTTLACNQMINGRKYVNTPSNLTSASKFLEFAKEEISEEFLSAFFEKLRQIKPLKLEELKSFIKELSQVELNEIILNYYRSEIDIWIKKSNLALLQKKAIENLVKTNIYYEKKL